MGLQLAALGLILQIQCLAGHHLPPPADPRKPILPPRPLPKDHTHHPGPPQVVHGLSWRPLGGPLAWLGHLKSLNMGLSRPPWRPAPLLPAPIAHLTALQHLSLSSCIDLETQLRSLTLTGCLQRLNL